MDFILTPVIRMDFILIPDRTSTAKIRKSEKWGALLENLPGEHFRGLPVPLQWYPMWFFVVVLVAFLLDCLLLSCSCCCCCCCWWCCCCCIVTSSQPASKISMTRLTHWTPSCKPPEPAALPNLSSVGTTECIQWTTQEQSEGIGRMSDHLPQGDNDPKNL